MWEWPASCNYTPAGGSSPLSCEVRGLNGVRADTSDSDPANHVAEEPGLLQAAAAKKAYTATQAGLADWSKAQASASPPETKSKLATAADAFEAWQKLVVLGQI